MLLKRFNSAEIFTIKSVDETLVFSEEDYQRLQEINKEQSINNLGLENAEEFIRLVKENWQSKEKFIFLVYDSNNKIQAAIDIQSPFFSGAEIGYWASQDTPGLMTNTILGICGLAKKEGYKSLFAITRKENVKSQDVLIRAGFTNVGNLEDRDHVSIKFTKQL